MYDVYIRTLQRGKLIKANSIHQAKIKASRAFPDCKGRWRLANGFTWRKGSSLFLLIPPELRNIDRS